ncbi:unnamed protein product [Acidithrix sp. C25]|nr:unnamed protein product [Acidithrix sp. C25]
MSIGHPKALTECQRSFGVTKITTLGSITSGYRYLKLTV